MKTKIKSKVVFIESNTTGTGELFIQRTLELGCYPILFTKTPNKYTFDEKTDFLLEEIDTTNRSECLEKLKSYDDVIAVFSTSEYYIATAYWLAEQLGLKGGDSKAIELCRDKQALQDHLKQLNLTQISSVKLSNQAEFNEKLQLIKTMNFPLITKPNLGSGSINVHSHDNSENLVSAVKQYFGKNYNTELLVQECIPGNEYSIETFSYNGEVEIIGITKKYISEPPYFIEVGHDYPVELLASEKELLINAIKQLFKSISFNFGPAHTEFKINKGKVYIIEVNPRLAGGMIPELIRLAQGVDIIDYILKSLIDDKKIALHKQRDQYASIRFILANKTGDLKNISFEDSEEPEQFSVYKPYGSYIEITHDFSDRVGHIIVTDKNYDSCKSRADNLIQKVSLNIE